MKYFITLALLIAFSAIAQQEGKPVYQAFLILIAFILAACASSGSKFNMADVDAMRPGQTTIEEAKAKLGPP